MEPVNWTEVLLLLTVVGAIGVVFWERVKRDQGIGRRTIQLLCVLLILPLTVLLALREVVGGEGVATIFGTVVGYVLTGVGAEKGE